MGLGGNTLKRIKRYQIIERIKPWRHIVETSVTRVPERLEQIDPNLFVCFNTKTQRFELHSLGNKTDTFCFSVPYDTLDDRMIEVFCRSNIRTRGIREIIREIDQENEERERRLEARRRSYINSWAREYRSVFKKAADEVY